MKCFKILIIAIFLCTAVVAIAQNNDTYWNNPRDYEPIILKGSDISEMLTKQIDDIFVYAYNSTLNEWKQIPFQFDKINDDDDYLEPTSGDVLTAKDEFVFVAQDVGDKAPDDGVWIEDEDSQNYQRVEICITDPVDSRKGYIYLYFSNTDEHNFVDKYNMEYIPDPVGATGGADTIKAKSYIQSHNQTGIPNLWILRGDNPVDILDRQKLFLDAYISTIFGLLPIPTHENFLEVNSTIEEIKVRSGAIRILHTTYWSLELYGNDLIIPFPQQFYPYNVEAQGISLNLDNIDEVVFKRAVFSFDLNVNANGMKFYNPYNENGLLINGTGGNDGIQEDINITPDINWYLVSGNQGSFSFLFKTNDIGDNRALYYRDNPSQNETGSDHMQYGETGIDISSANSIEGRMSFIYKAFYFGDEKDYAFGEALGNNYQYPIEVSIENSGYVPVPVELAGFNAEVEKNTVYLSWSTATESNNYGFEIHRKSDNDFSSWTVLDFIEGNGTTTIEQHYSFKDKDLAPGDYNYKLKQIDFDGSFAETLLSEKIIVKAPNTFTLDQNYPNPFNPATNINYQIPDIASGQVNVSLIVYNLLGNKVRTIVSEKQSPGFYKKNWDGRDDNGMKQPSGTYIYRLHVNEYIATKRMVLLK